MCGAKDTAAEFTYVPNDTYLGGDLPTTMLLTGPNMGGKSTLMRQVAVLVILAQIVSLDFLSFPKIGYIVTVGYLGVVL